MASLASRVVISGPVRGGQGRGRGLPVTSAGAAAVAVGVAVNQVLNGW